MKFCLGVTLYNPNLKELTLILSLQKVFSKIYVYDNSKEKCIEKNRNFFNRYKEIEFITNNSNDGLATAYNNMCIKSISDGYSYICLLDQDSEISYIHLTKAIDHIEKNFDDRVAVYAPQIYYSHQKKVLSDDCFDKSSIKREVKWAISSGSFINLALFEKVNMFDENYFIDRLDYDYCYVMRLNGYKIIEIKNYILYQNLGEIKSKNGKKISQHTPLRHYYISRNRLYFYNKKETSIFPIKYTILFLSSLKHIFYVIRKEDDKLEKVKMIFKGYNDFFNGNMGKYNNGKKEMRIG